MQQIQTVGIDKLKEEEKRAVNTLTNEYYKKIERLLKNELSIKLHIKQRSKGGKKKKSDIRIRVIAPTRIFEAQESDWSLTRTLHKVFNNIIREIEHHFKG